MSEATKKFQDPYVQVEFDNVVLGGKESDNKVCVVVPDGTGGDARHIVSKDYKLWQNSAVNEAANDIFSRSKYSWIERKTYFDGKRYNAFYWTDETVAQIQNGATNEIKLGCKVRNAYDGTGAVGFDFFGLNGSCLNEYHSANLFGSYVWRHTENDGIDINDAITQISVGAEKLIEVAPRIQSWNEKDLQVDHVVAARNESGRLEHLSSPSRHPASSH